jgi:maltooligosyltrehalose synthase
LAVSGGDNASHVVAFLRGGEIAVVVPTRTVWNGGQVLVNLPAGTWSDVLTNRDLPGGEQSVCALWRTFPVALLERRAA